MAPRVPLLQQRGLQLIERPADNVELAAYKGLLLKGSYWRWPERHLAGNAIYFFVKVQVVCLGWSQFPIPDARRWPGPRCQA
jgi:hypothetical protein